MSTGDASDRFTARLLEAVRLQRHHGLRMVVSTQEPTVSPKLLDLCSMTIVHRFHSPAWYATLKSHIFGISQENGEVSNNGTSEGVLAQIMQLGTGEALLFAPMAVFGANAGHPVRLGQRIVKMKTRMRLSEDGGKSRRANR